MLDIRPQERNLEACSLADLALYAHRPSVQFDQTLGNRKAQPRAAVARRARRIHTEESLEDTLVVVARNADAGIAHHEAASLLRPPRGDPYLSATRRISDRIVDEDRQDALHNALIPAHRNHLVVRNVF